MEVRNETSSAPIDTQVSPENTGPDTKVAETTSVTTTIETTASLETPSPKGSRKKRRAQRARSGATGPIRDALHSQSATEQAIETETQRWAREYTSAYLDLFNPADNTHYHETMDDGNIVVAEKYEGLVASLEDLSAARAKLAEVSVSLRNGKALTTDSKREDLLTKAEQAYQDARQLAAAEIVATLPSKTKLERKQALLAEFGAREDGALMGEEANYYLDRQNTAFQRGLEKYRGLSRGKKIAAGIGVAAGIATIGVVGGLVVGGAAAGATVGARFGKGYIKREADRKETRTLLEKQQDSVLRTSNYEDFVATRETYATTRNKNILLSAFDENTGDYLIKNDEIYLAEAKTESEAKRSTIKKAMVGAAIGALIGGLADIATDHVDLWPFDNHVEDMNALHDQLDSMNEQVEDMQSQLEDYIDQQEAVDTPTEAPDVTPEAAPEVEPTPEAPAISPEAEYLYGEFAGETISLDIPAGSNLWDQLELAVDEQNPYVTFEEKQRLVGNMLAVLQEQNPGRDLNLVYPGEHFEINLPS